jgi:hypothetical protein
VAEKLVRTSSSPAGQGQLERRTEIKDTHEEAVTLAVHVDGPVHGRLTLPADVIEAQAREQALNCDASAVT